MKNTQKQVDALSYKIIGCAIEIHKVLGPGLLESVYEKCFLRELQIQNLAYEAQQWLPIEYKEQVLDTGLKPDVLIEKTIVVEIKAVEMLLPVQEAQLLTYMKLMSKPKGILLNFNCRNIFKEGQKTLVNQLYGLLPMF